MQDTVVLARSCKILGAKSGMILACWSCQDLDKISWPDLAKNVCKGRVSTQCLCATEGDCVQPDLLKEESPPSVYVLQKETVSEQTYYRN